MSKIAESLTIAALMIATSLGIVAAQKTGLVTVDAGTRAGMVFYTLFIAYYGNLIPKAMLRSERARAARRFGGWAFVLSGGISAALWIAAPIAFATPVTIALVGSAVVAVFGYCLISRRATQ